MRRTTICLVLVIGLLFSVTATVMAAASITDDTWVGLTEPDVNKGSDFGLSVSSSGGPGGCTVSNAVYLKWSLAGVNDEASNDTTNSTLTLTSALVTGNGNLALYAVDDDSWTEAAVTWNTAPAARATPLATVANPATPGPVTFSSQALVDYINEESLFVGKGDAVAGDNSASFAVKLIDCSGLSNQFYAYNSETGGDNAPALNLYNPTAVTLTTLSASDSTLNWPLIAGLAFLAAFGVTGALVLARKRVTAH